MMKLLMRVITVLLMLIVCFTSPSTTVLADSDLLIKDETNKLTLEDSIKEGSKKIEESLASGKSVTYKIDVPKGTLYMDLTDSSSFKVAIYDSKDNEVKKINSVEIYGGLAYQVRNGVALSKGKYTLKISPKSKESALNIKGEVAIIKSGTSRSIEIEKDYHTSVTKGKTYKFKFEVKEKSLFGFVNYITAYKTDYADPKFLDYKLLDSKGKQKNEHTDSSVVEYITLNKGTYTIEVKANYTGYLTTRVNSGDYELKFDFDFRME